MLDTSEKMVSKFGVSLTQNQLQIVKLFSKDAAIWDTFFSSFFAKFPYFGKILGTGFSGTRIRQKYNHFSFYFEPYLAGMSNFCEKKSIFEFFFQKKKVFLKLYFSSKTHFFHYFLRKLANSKSPVNGFFETRFLFLLFSFYARI